MAAATTNTVRTSFFILSDTHGECPPAHLLPTRPFDVAIHCGDLTDESKLDEFKQAIQMMAQIDASLKIMIAGNHDFTLDDSTFREKVAEIPQPVDPELVAREYGRTGQARALLEDARTKNIHYLDEGNHIFELANGANLKVFASPYTPSTNEWGFQYHPDEHKAWPISEGTDVVITHGPPKGIFDKSGTTRLGCQQLFEAVAKARPLLHCFGHVHSGWGAKLATWKELDDGSALSHFTAIDGDKSTLITDLQRLHPVKLDSPEMVDEKAQALAQLERDGKARCSLPVDPWKQTVFVNAAVQGSLEHPWRHPWLVDLHLPRVRP